MRTFLTYCARAAAEKTVSDGFHGEPAVGSLVFSGSSTLEAFSDLERELTTGLWRMTGCGSFSSVRFRESWNRNVACAWSGSFVD